MKARNYFKKKLKENFLSVCIRSLSFHIPNDSEDYTISGFIKKKSLEIDESSIWGMREDDNDATKPLYKIFWPNNATK